MISFNFAGNNLERAMTASDVAGAPGVRVGNWNNTSGLNNQGDVAVINSGGDIIDSAGATMGKLVVKITAGSTAWGGDWAPGSAGSNDAQLFAGVFDQYSGTPMTVSVTGIPYGSYDVYFYMYDDAAGRVGSFTIGSTTYYANGGAGNPTADGSGYVLSLDTDSSDGYDKGNTVHFTGLSGDLNASLLGINGGNLDRNKVAGFQIVDKSSPGPARSPQPEDKATDVLCDVILSWTPGPYAKTHNVYLGLGYDDVNAASVTSPRGVLASQGQDPATYAPASQLAYGQTYYWRVDEVNAAPDSSLYKGDVWSFTVEPYGYPVKPVKATASGSSNPLMGPEKTIDGSGLDAMDQHSTSGTHMWVSKKGVTPIWIQYEFDKVYKLHEMWVWNSNQTVEPDIGLGAKDVTIQTSLDGSTWTALAGVPEFAQATGEPNYTHNTTVDFGGVQAKYVKLTITTNWADGTKQAGLSEVRFFYVPVKAYQPTPATGAAGVALDTVLNWRPGRDAVRHEVYLGIDPNALTLVKTVTDHRCAVSSLGVEYGRTYYWRVNEVNDAATPTSWTGDIWSFSIPDHFVIDDFEGYNDRCNRVFFSWVDGFGYSGSADCGMAASSGNGTGSTVGNVSAPFAEKTIVYDGKQSMPLAYDNTAGKGYSEATRTFDVAQDWTAGGVKTLVLYFHGGSDNGAGQLYVKINGVKVPYNGNAAAITLPMWKQWNVGLTSVSGLQAVKTLAIGVSGSGKGTLYIDDILLWRAVPAVVVSADPGTGSLQAYYPLDGSTSDSSGHGYNGTAMGNQTYTAAPAGRGQAIQLNGTNDYVDLPIGTLISTLTSTTIASWVNFSNSGAGWERVFDIGTGTTDYMFLSARQAGTTPMVFGILKTGGTEIRCTAPRPMGTGWHHLAIVIDSVAMNLTLYLDGTAVATNATTYLPRDLGKTTQNWLGHSQFVDDGYFSGLLDEVRIYNRALTEGEVRYLVGDRQ